MVRFEGNISAHTTGVTSPARKGRPPKDFSEVSNQNKRQKFHLCSLLENYLLEQLTFGTHNSLKR